METSGPFDDLRLREVHRERPVQLVATGLGTDWGDGPRAPYAAAEATRVGAGRLVAGLTDARAEHDGRRVRLVGPRGELAARRVRLPVGATLGLTLCENHLTAFVRRRARWRPVLTTRVGDLDLGDPAVLARQRWCDPGAGEGRHGPFGQVGVRDQRLVTEPDGSAYVRDGRVYLTMTCAGPGGFRQAYMGVFSLDPARPDSLRRVGALFFRRDGRVLGDCAGQLVRDGDHWLVVVSSWGDYGPRRGVHVRAARSADDLLSGVHVLDSQAVDLPVPEGTRATWDPALLRTDDGWLLAYVEATSLEPMRFDVAVARAGGPGPFDGLERLGPVSASGQTEGPVLVRRSGRPWLLASDATTRRYVVADPLTTGQVGALDASYPSNIPHPQLLERADGTWLMVTFDGTRLEPRRRHSGRRPVLGYGSHGDLVVLASG